MKRPELSEEDVDKIATQVTRGLADLDIEFKEHGAEPYVYVEGPSRPPLTAQEMDKRKSEAMAYDIVPASERLLSYKEFCAQADSKS